MENNVTIESPRGRGTSFRFSFLKLTISRVISADYGRFPQTAFRIMELFRREKSPSPGGGGVAGRRKNGDARRLI